MRERTRRDDDKWMFVERATEEELAEMEEKERAFLATEYEGDFVFTCSDCGVRYHCALAFDGYNIDGDCLASK